MNEIEYKVNDICFKIQRTKSKDCAIDDKDMVQFTIRTEDKLFGDIN